MPPARYMDGQGYIPASLMPRRDRRVVRSTTYMKGAVLAGYTAKDGTDITVAIREAGYYTLHRGGLTAVVQAAQTVQPGAYAWIVDCHVSIHVWTRILCATHTKAAETAKEWIEGITRLPIRWFMPAHWAVGDPVDVAAAESARDRVRAEYAAYLTEKDLPE